MGQHATARQQCTGISVGEQTKGTAPARMRGRPPQFHHVRPLCGRCRTKVNEMDNAFQVRLGKHCGQPTRKCSNAKGKEGETLNSDIAAPLNSVTQPARTPQFRHAARPDSSIPSRSPCGPLNSGRSAFKVQDGKASFSLGNGPFLDLK